MTTESFEPDGRRRKGRRRRRLLLDATIRVIERGGVAAVSQRTVAREAELPPSSVTYYFPTVDELLLATLADCTDRYVDWLRDLGRHPPDRAVELLARDIAEYAGADRSRLFAEYELCLLAARRADLRPQLDRWTAAVDDLAARLVTEDEHRIGLGAAIDGLLLRMLWVEPSPPVETVHRALTRLIG